MLKITGNSLLIPYLDKQKTQEFLAAHGMPEKDIDRLEIVVKDGHVHWSRLAAGRYRTALTKTHRIYINTMNYDPYLEDSSTEEIQEMLDELSFTLVHEIRHAIDLTGEYKKPYIIFAFLKVSLFLCSLVFFSSVAISMTIAHMQLWYLLWFLGFPISFALTLTIEYILSPLEKRAYAFERIHGAKANLFH